MKDFRERLYHGNSKLVDNTIMTAIDEVMQYLENQAEVKEYLSQIRDRRNGIRNIFEDFNHNMGIIEENRRGSNSKTKRPNKVGYEQALDNVINRRIKSKIETLYETTLQDSLSNTDERNRILAQIQDRQERVDFLFADYRTNMSILQDHSKQQIVSDFIPEMMKTI